MNASRNDCFYKFNNLLVIMKNITIYDNYYIIIDIIINIIYLHLIIITFNNIIKNYISITFILFVFLSFF